MGNFLRNKKGEGEEGEDVERKKGICMCLHWRFQKKTKKSSLEMNFFQIFRLSDKKDCVYKLHAH